MSKFVSRAAFFAAASYSGATAQAQRGQLWDAMQAAFGLTDVNRTTVAATGALTLAQCGALLVDATAGNMVLTLPASGAATDEAVFEVYRLDATAFTITIAAAGADTIDGAASVLVKGTMTLRLPAGSTVWRVQSISGATPAKARAAIGAASTAGTTTNDNAAAGNVGEYLEAASGVVGVASGTAVNIVSLALTGGDWEVWGVSQLAGTGATISLLALDVSLTTATLDVPYASYQMGGAVFSSASTGPLGIVSRHRRFSIPAGGASVYLNLLSFFGAGTLATSANLLCARRVR